MRESFTLLSTEFTTLYNRAVSDIANFIISLVCPLLHLVNSYLVPVFLDSVANRLGHISVTSTFQITPSFIRKLMRCRRMSSPH